MTDDGVDPSFARHFARQVVLAARLVETREDRKRRDALWLAERRTLWEPLFLLAHIIKFPLRIVSAVQSGVLFGFQIWGLFVKCYLAMLIIAGPHSVTYCPLLSYEERHSCRSEWMGDNSFRATVDEFCALVVDHAYRQTNWLLHGRTDIGGCWRHPEPSSPSVSPLLVAWNHLYKLPFG